MPQNSGTKNLIVILCILFSLVIGLATAYSYQGSGTLSSPISFISPSGEYVSSPDGGYDPHLGPSSHIAGPADVVPIPVPASPVGPCCVILNTDETWNLASDTCNESDSACYSCGGTWMDSDTDENWEAICQAAQPVVKEKPCCVNVENNGQWSLLEGNCANGSNICEDSCGGTWVDPTTDKNWAEICQAGQDSPVSCCIDLQDDGEYTYLQLPYNQSADTCFNGGGLWIDETTDENYREICVESVSPTPFVPSPACPCLCESGPSGAVIYSPPPAPTAPISTAPIGTVLCDPTTGTGAVGCDNSVWCSGNDPNTSVKSYYLSDKTQCSASPDECKDNNELIAASPSPANNCADALSLASQFSSDPPCDFQTQSGNEVNLGSICPESCASDGYCPISPTPAPISPTPAPISPTSPTAAPISPTSPTSGVVACDQDNLIPGCDNSEFCGGGDSGITSYYISPTALCSASPDECADNDALIAAGSPSPLVQTCAELVQYKSCDEKSQNGEGTQFYNICPVTCDSCQDVTENFMIAGDMPNRSFSTIDPTILDSKEKQVVDKIAKFGEKFNLGENISKYIENRTNKSRIGLQF